MRRWFIRHADHAFMVVVAALLLTCLYSATVGFAPTHHRNVMIISVQFADEGGCFAIGEDDDYMRYIISIPPSKVPRPGDRWNVHYRADRSRLWQLDDRTEKAPK